jgi:hypothetical protein
MTDFSTKKSHETAPDFNGQGSAILKILNRVLAPLVRLCLANGITYAAANEVLKRLFVHEADLLHPGASEHGKVSRISTATGINRYEVTRLTKLEATPKRVTKQPLASEVLARWTTDHSYRNPNGVLSVMNRLGPVPSFEALAQTVTRDVHHRSVLDELIRLDMVIYDESQDLVSLVLNNFVPKSDHQQMLNFLGDNVGDHLNAAVANVLRESKSHHEQAIFADELSRESLEALSPLIMAHWNAIHEDMVPTINALIEADAIAGRTQDQRVRIGLYSFTEATTEMTPATKGCVTRRFRKSATKENTI